MSSGHVCRCSVADPHTTFGQCMRWKGVRVAYCQSAANKDYTAQKRWDRDLDRYEAARRQGIQPETTLRSAVEAAERWSDKHGRAYTPEALSSLPAA